MKEAPAFAPPSEMRHTTIARGGNAKMNRQRSFSKHAKLAAHSSRVAGGNMWPVLLRINYRDAIADTVGVRHVQPRLDSHKDACLAQIGRPEAYQASPKRRG